MALATGSPRIQVSNGVSNAGGNPELALTAQGMANAFIFPVRDPRRGLLFGFNNEYPTPHVDSLAAVFSVAFDPLGSSLG